MAKRLQAMGQERYRNAFKLTLHPDLLDAPLGWKKPRVIFVNSMSDLFHRDVPFGFIEQCFRVMEQAHWHTFQVLTKRPERVAKLAMDLPWPRNVWLGTSVENADYVWRVHELTKVPASIRFLSVEPLLGPIAELPVERIDWVIVGGESGPGARAMSEDWVRQIHDQCVAHNVPFFFKQWGGINKKQAGRLFDNRTWDEMPRLLTLGKVVHMKDSLGTVWPIEPHTQAKHAILGYYLNAWMPILSHQARTAKSGTSEILFIDGFAGPGEYQGGEKGSPVIALEAALGHTRPFPAPVRFLFVEGRSDRVQRLRDVLERYRSPIEQSDKVRVDKPRHGECDTILAEILDEHEKGGVRFGPALAFLDQFGYGAVSMKLVRRLLQYPSCEVFLYLDYKDMNRWITDPDKAICFTRTFGGEEWRGAISMPERIRRQFLLQSYVTALRARANAKYVQSFAMFDKSGTPLYWLIFCTGNLRGLEEMKRAMWRVDKTGSFRFSDQDNPEQIPLLDVSFSQEWLAEQLEIRLADRTMSVGEVKEFVLTETPCYLYKEALAILERKTDGMQVQETPLGRRRGAFPNEDIIVKFPPCRLF